MLSMTVSQVAQAVGGHAIHVIHGNATACEESQISVRNLDSVVTDSRQVREGSVFVAIAGERVDGHDFVEAAAGLGAGAAIVDHEVAIDDEQLAANIVQIVVPDTIAALGALAHANIELRRELAGQCGDFHVVGITGSVGKTTTKDLLNNLLSTLGNTIAPIGSFNNEIGLPLTALRVDEHTRFLVAEMGASHMGEIRYLTSLVRPDIAVVLKVGVAHVGEFGSADNIRKAKQEIVEALDEHGVAVLNADDERVRTMAAAAPGKIIWFGKDCQDIDSLAGGHSYVQASNVSVDGHDHAHFTLRDTQAKQSQVTLALSGEHQVMNALAAAAVAQYMGVSSEQIVQVLARSGAQSAHRMDAFSKTFTLDEAQVECTVIDDSFNANPDSMRAGLRALSHWQDTDSHGKAVPMIRVAVLGAMLELGPQSDTLHREIGRDTVELGADAVISVGNGTSLNTLAQDLVQGARDAGAQSELPKMRDDTSDAARPYAVEVSSLEDAQHAFEAYSAAALRAQPSAHIVVLLKGSHASGIGTLADQWHQDAQTREGTLQ